MTIVFAVFKKKVSDVKVVLSMTMLFIDDISDIFLLSPRFHRFCHAKAHSCVVLYLTQRLLPSYMSYVMIKMFLIVSRITQYILMIMKYYSFYDAISCEDALKQM